MLLASSNDRRATNEINESSQPQPCVLINVYIQKREYEVISNGFRLKLNSVWDETQAKQYLHTLRKNWKTRAHLKILYANCGIFYNFTLFHALRTEYLLYVQFRCCCCYCHFLWETRPSGCNRKTIDSRNDTDFFFLFEHDVHTFAFTHCFHLWRASDGMQSQWW